MKKKLKLVRETVRDMPVKTALKGGGEPSATPVATTMPSDFNVHR